jgi:four helix bundle protein
LDFGIKKMEEATGAKEKAIMNEQALRDRTKQLALRVIKMVSQLPSNPVAAILGRQILRSGTSVGANYREACRARSRAEMISKLGIVEQELDESCYWLELLVDGGIVSSEKMSLLLQEADELLRIIIASVRTLKQSPD